MDDDVFEYGDRTIFQLRAQPLAIDEEYGTICSKPTRDLPIAPPMAIDAEPAGDRVALLEQKLEGALRRIELLQQRIDSMDATLARALNRT
jgi:hypothetical protein